MPDDRSLETQRAASTPSAMLLDVVAGMLSELRPTAPPRPICLDDSIERDLGLDSLSRAELVVRIERAFDVRLPERMASAARTPRDLLEAIGKSEHGPAAVQIATSPASLSQPVVGTPERACTIVDAFRWHLEHHPEREHIRLLDGDETLETISYARLWDASREVAGGLAARGIGRGDAVALMLPTGSAFFQAFLGTMLLGAVPVPLYPPLRWAEIEEHLRGRAAILANCLARALVTVPEAMFIGRIARAMLPRLQAVVSVERLRSTDANRVTASMDSGDLALLQYTSGSTGDPKGVMLSHENLLANIRVMGAAAAVSPRDRFVSWLPLYHDMGLIGAWLTMMYFAVPIVLMSPASFLSRPARWLRTIHRYGGTISGGPNFAYEIAASKIRDEDLEGVNLHTWRLAFNGAEPVRATTLARFASRYARYGLDRRALTPVYGLAESALGLAFPPLGRGPRVDRIDAKTLARDGNAVVAADASKSPLEVVSCGSPLPGYEIRVVDERGREVAERIEGRVEFRGPSATSGYYRNPAATAKLIHDGWLDTGDVGYVADGELFLTSRAKDLIKRGGHNIHPYDLEAAIGDIAGIRKGCVAVFGTMDRAIGTERVIVVAETNQTDAASRAGLRDRIMALSAIHLDGAANEVLLVPPRTVLKTSSGKIRRAACQELYDKGLLQASRRAVWLQIARLVGQAASASVRRSAHATAQAAYGVYAWFAAFVLTIVGLLLLAFSPGTPARMRIARIVAKALLQSCRIPLTVEGLEQLPAGKPAVIVANHASYLDALVLFAVLSSDAHFVAKREFERMPLIGSVLRQIGTYFVERVDPAGGIDATHELVAAASRGETVILFPEGTFSRAPGIAAFHLGAFAVSVAAAVPVIPIVLRGTRSVLRDHRWLPVRYPVVVSVQSPIVPDGSDWSAAVRMRDRVREVMLQHCGEPDLARRA